MAAAATAFAAATATAAIGGAHGFAGLAAVLTAVGFVLETLLLVKPLLAGTEDELASTIHTVEHFISVHETRTP
jgi:hypothetical protein